MSAASNFMDLFFPGVRISREQDALKRLQEQIQSSLGAFGPQTMTRPFQAETFGPEDPLQQLQSQGQTGLLEQFEQPGLFTKPQIESLSGLMANPATRQFGQDLLTKSSGGFAGTSFPAQGGNILINAANKLRNNESLNETLKDQVNFVASNLTRPRTITDAAGNVQTIPGQDLSSFNELLKATGFTGGQEKKTIKPITSTQAAAIANAQSALKDIGLAQQAFFEFDQTGNPVKLNRDTAFAANVPLIGGMPGTEGRDARQQVRRAIETILRARSGAAVPPAEVDNYMDLYAPSALDSDQGAIQKMPRLNEFFNTSLNLMQAPGWKPEPLSNIRNASIPQLPPGFKMK